MISNYLQSFDIFSWQIIALLILAGFLVGVINTFAGSGTVISYSLFMLLGLPATAANGTIRLGVILQTFAASCSFYRHDALSIKRGLWLALPITIGSVAGAQIAVSINHDIFEKIVGVVMLLMLFLLFYKPKRWVEGKKENIRKKPTYLQHIIYFFIGIYGGFIHIGVGIFLLSALVLVSGYDLVKANALKVFAVFIYSPFVLAVFIFNGEISYAMGLISAIGNLIGGIAASYFAVKKGANFVKWVVIVVIALFSAKLFGLYQI